MTLNFPDNPVLNQTYSYGSIIWRYDGEKWRVTGTASQPTVQVSATIPSSGSASVGDAWVDSDNGALYIFYDGFWVAPNVNYAVGTSAIGTSQIATSAVTDSKVASPESWYEIGAAGNPAFTNSWVNYGDVYNTAAYYKDHQNRVFLKGLIKSGTRGSAAFTLPVGYRPVKNEIFPSMSNDQISRTDVTSAGAVIPTSFSTGSNAYVSLDGISFRAV